ncbi:MAG: DNA topoisomerase 3 [Eisenbergiella sp.]
MKLVLAEKPSVAQSIAKVLRATKREDGYLEGNGYIVSWCVGHLVELSQPEAYDEKYHKWVYADLPIFPEQWKYQVSAATKKQFGILKKLMERKDVESLVCATDAGREGELIFRLVYHQCGCKKPFERLWISSMEDSAIEEGFEQLKPSTEYDALYEAALCRERADWLVGINATRLFSTLYGQTLNVGRVMTPTLAMAVMREAAISAFKAEPFYTVELMLQDFKVSSERIKQKEQADELCRNCVGSVLTVTKAENKEKSEKPPALYDLTSLQRNANRVLGFTAQQTLDYTQSLYEKKLVTYPRTDSRYLTSDMENMLPELVQSVFHTFPVDKVENIPVYPSQVINNKKVTDHHAIIPTKEVLKYNLDELPKGELAVLKLIATRLFCAVGEPFRYSESVVELSDGNHVFSAKGKITIQLGWKIFSVKSDNKDKDDIKQLPSLMVGEGLSVHSAEVKEGKTSPPKHFTEDTLLQSMETAGADEMPEDAERKGLGTPATRAAIIEKLVRIGFLERKGEKKTKYLIPTHKGTALVTVMPEQIQSPSMTADWEQKLSMIEHGEYGSHAFLKEIQDMISSLVQTYETVKGADALKAKETHTIGACPVCGNPVGERQKGFFCSDRQCGFALWKNNRYFESIGKSMTAAVVQKLLSDGKVKLKGCKSARTGKTYDAIVQMEISPDGKVSFRMEFENGGKRK